MNRYGFEEERISGILTEEQADRFRAMAWRHCHRNNPAAARRIWLMVRRREGKFLGLLKQAA